MIRCLTASDFTTIANWRTTIVYTGPHSGVREMAHASRRHRLEVNQLEAKRSVPQRWVCPDTSVRLALRASEHDGIIAVFLATLQAHQSSICRLQLSRRHEAQLMSADNRKHSLGCESNRTNLDVNITFLQQKIRL